MSYVVNIIHIVYNIIIIVPKRGFSSTSLAGHQAFVKLSSVGKLLTTSASTT